MTLDTMSKSLPYFTLKPRAKTSSTDLVFTFPSNTTIISGQLWTGYDQFSQFEAYVKVWLHPMASTGFSGSVFLGGVYQHKHVGPVSYITSMYEPAMFPNDYYPLQELRDINQRGPLTVQAGSTVTTDRGIFNIDNSRSFNAWDVELILVVDK